MRRAALAVALLVPLALAACGGGGEELGTVERC